MKLIGLLLAVCMAWGAREQELSQPYMRGDLLSSTGHTALSAQFYVLALITLALSYALVRLIISKRRRDSSLYRSSDMRSHHYAYWMAASASLLSAGGLVGWLVAERPALNIAGYILAVARSIWIHLRRLFLPILQIASS